MALPNVDEIWQCDTTSKNEPDQTPRKYKVVALADRVADGGATVTADYYAVVKLLTGGAGFHNRVRRSFMDDSSIWTVVV